ncbi:tetratricopeptide repeat protein [candidate division KSB1 bacterium]|nr:tetratricopeptide repeat protein [Nitrospinaceae bacterium]NIR49159.1 tetratricopeptide repeat protein [candidate division KSB1 bacterium]NIS24660.1 tetratricopeptide repeat protein [candidate division KSB1 bacterium]NIT71562.1 tetratricopeptide repeat protein [candidate division KSB1 bacterium]NIU25260.1 tetratricopeptide repeat protein [candidate division KSB1 bacterium]
MKDPQDGPHFIQLTLYIFGACMIIGLFAAPSLNLAFVFKVLVFSLTVAFVANHLIIKTGNLAGGLFHRGSHEQDDKAILKGRFKQAHGLQMAGRYSQAENVYREIMAEYPDAIEAQFLLAQLLWTELERPGEALRLLRELERKIRRDDLDFKYRKALQKYIAEWSEEEAHR